MKTIIRKASMADAEAIGRLFYETAIAVARELYPMPKARELALACAANNLWQEYAGQGRYLVATNAANEIIGCSSMRPTGCIDWLCVHPAQQGHGIASQLLEALSDTASQLQLPRLIANANLASASFFEDHGFSVQGLQASDIAGIHFTTVILAARAYLL